MHIPLRFIYAVICVVKLIDMFRTTFIIFSIFIIVGCNKAPFDYDLYESQPIVKVEVNIQAKSESELESMLKPFAENNGYQLRISRVHPQDSQFSIMMWRIDSMILASNPFGTYKFNIHRSKKDSISTDTADDLGAILNKLEGRNALLSHIKNKIKL